mmetsp:Transcript_149873/g.481516  ORF Transcript_149873/g.481516 Transcript_149873/m.481516 type:complete len:111 (+) Transcript_149873:185-517(+)
MPKRHPNYATVHNYNAPHIYISPLCYACPGRCRSRPTERREQAQRVCFVSSSMLTMLWRWPKARSRISACACDWEKDATFSMESLLPKEFRRLNDHPPLRGWKLRSAMPP